MRLMSSHYPTDAQATPDGGVATARPSDRENASIGRREQMEDRERKEIRTEITGIKQRCK